MTAIQIPYDSQSPIIGFQLRTCYQKETRRAKKFAASATDAHFTIYA